MIDEIFPEVIRNLPQAEIPLAGITAYLSQAKNHQIIFMQFSQDVDLPEHAHAAQVGFVLEGQIDLVIDGKAHSYRRGDRYSIPAGVKHAGKIHAGYADIIYFDEANRYRAKTTDSGE